MDSRVDKIKETKTFLYRWYEAKIRLATHSKKVMTGSSFYVKLFRFRDCNNRSFSFSFTLSSASNHLHVLYQHIQKSPFWSFGLY